MLVTRENNHIPLFQAKQWIVNFLKIYDGFSVLTDILPTTNAIVATNFWEQCFASVVKAVQSLLAGRNMNFAPFFYAHLESAMINFECSNCGKSYKVNDEMAGRKGSCQQCGNEITVPPPISSVDPNPFTVPPPVSDNSSSQGAAVAWQAAAQIGQAARLLGQVAAQSSTFSWLIDWEFQDIRIHKSYRPLI